MFKCYLFLFLILVFFNKGVFSGFWRLAFGPKSEKNIASGINSENKIVGGEDVNIKNYPYQASLSILKGKTYYQCGGSIISNKYVLTAAHCLAGMDKVYVRIGSTRSDSGGHEYTAERFFYHNEYNNETSDYDVGLVKVKMNLDNVNSKAVKLVKIENIKEKEIVVITGWGNTKENGSVSHTLKAVQVPVVSQKECSAEIKEVTITPRMFCAGLYEGGKDACQGDSGGPVVIKSSGLLAGIVSFGIGCAQRHKPGVYTNIGNEKIRVFILSNADV